MQAYYHGVSVEVLTAFSQCCLIRCLLNQLSFVVPTEDLVFIQSYTELAKRMKA